MYAKYKQKNTRFDDIMAFHTVVCMWWAKWPGMFPHYIPTVSPSQAKMEFSSGGGHAVASLKYSPLMSHILELLFTI